MLKRLVLAISATALASSSPVLGQSAPATPAPSIAVPRAVLERYVGRYELNGTTVTVGVTADNRLTVQLAGQPVSPPLRTISATEFAADEAGVRLAFEGDGPKATRIHSWYAGSEVVGTRIADAGAGASSSASPPNPAE